MGCGGWWNEGRRKGEGRTGMGERTLHDNYLVFTAGPFMLLNIVYYDQCKHRFRQFELLPLTETWQQERGKSEMGISNCTSPIMKKDMYSNPHQEIIENVGLP